MSQDDCKDSEALIDALRADLPSVHDRERVRLRLMAAGALVASAGLPAGAAAASNGVSVAGSAWVTKLAATGWATKLALVAVASAVVAAPTAVVVLSSRASVEDGLSAASSRARQALVVAAPVAARDGVGASAAAAVVVPSGEPATSAQRSAGDEATGTSQLMAAAVGAGQGAPAVAAKVAVSSPASLNGAAREATSRASRMLPLSVSSSSRGSPLGATAPAPANVAAPRQLTAAIELGTPAVIGDIDSPGSAPRTAVGPVALALVTSASSGPQQPSARPAASAEQPVTNLASRGAIASVVSSPEPSVGVHVSQPSAASEPAKFYAGPELARPQLAGVRRGPASELARETQLIERALAALRVDDVPAARSWLNMHAARYPNGLLSRERERVLQRIQESAHTRHAGRASADYERQ